MNTDDIIAAVLESGLYRANTDQGTLTGPSGRTLACPPDRDGYRSVSLCFEGRQITARLHRIIAAAAWGIDAIRGREVGHRNGNLKENAIGNLWLPTNLNEHYHHDNKVNPKYRGGVPARTEWVACVLCGTMEGRVFQSNRCQTPSRIDGKRLGVEGKLCWKCYHRLDARERRKNKEKQ